MKNLKGLLTIQIKSKLSLKECKQIKAGRSEGDPYLDIDDLDGYGPE